jgi:hypothetical protein
MVEVGKVEECCDLEDGANLHFLVCFKDLENSMKNILTSFFRTLYFWMMAFLFSLSISFADFPVRFSLPSQVLSFVYFQCTTDALCFQ